MGFKETYAEQRAQHMTQDVKLWAELGNNHFAVSRNLFHTALTALLFTVEERDALYQRIHTDSVTALAADDVQAEVYTVRTLEADGEVDGKYFLRVLGRDGKRVDSTRKPIGKFQRHIVRASAADLKPESDVE